MTTPLGDCSRAVCTAVCALGLVGGCGDTAPARPQLVIVVDTDAPLIGELASHPELSNDAAIDTVRVDVLDANDTPQTIRTFVVAELAEWPVSFGVLPAHDGD